MTFEEFKNQIKKKYPIYTFVRSDEFFKEMKENNYELVYQEDYGNVDGEFNQKWYYNINDSLLICYEQCYDSWQNGGYTDCYEVKFDGYKQVPIFNRV